MNKLYPIILATVLLMTSVLVNADDIEGVIESIDQDAQSLMVQGIVFFVTTKTDYDDGLKGFSDLKVGQRVEVDFNYRDGKHYATEVELEQR